MDTTPAGVTASAFCPPEESVPAANTSARGAGVQLLPRVEPGTPKGYPKPGALSLKDLGTKEAYAPLPSPGARAKMHPAQRAGLKKALAGAPQANAEIELLRGDLTRVKERLQAAEKDLSEKSQALVTQSAQTDARLAGFTEDLAAAAVTNLAAESRLRVRTLYLRLTLGAALSAVAACAFLLARSGIPSSSATVSLRQQEAVSNRISVGPADGPLPGTKAGKGPPIMANLSSGSTEESFDRLDRALSGLALPEIDRALGEANKWLKASGESPCAVRFNDGKISLLVTQAGKGGSPLAASLSRCAQAVEHVVAANH